MKKSFAFCMAWAVAFVVTSCSADVDNIKVDAALVEQHITPYLYGSCIEDVNHEVYGGLYDQKIFGESFEEPVASEDIKDFAALGAYWNVVENGELMADIPLWGKLIYKHKVEGLQAVEVEVKFLMPVSTEARMWIGSGFSEQSDDAFKGYEYTYEGRGKKLRVKNITEDGKRNTLKDTVSACDPTQWNKLRVEKTADQVNFYLNGEPVFTTSDVNNAFADGQIAFYSYYVTHLKYRNLKITASGQEQDIAFEAAPREDVSRFWDVVKQGGVNVRYKRDSQQAYNGNYSQLVEFLSGTGKAGISNASLNRWGIYVKKGQKFQGSIFLRGQAGSVKVALQSKDGQHEYASQELRGITGTWKKFNFELTSNAQDKEARFAVYMEQPGKLWVDQVTLMQTGGDQFRGLPMRNDIGQAMVDEGLTFLRFGGTMTNSPEFRFKNMIGNRDNRPPYYGYYNAYATNGFGIEDFVQFCEKAGFTCAFAINIEEAPQDIADMVEYLNGDAATTWGKKRAENGHPAPYNVKYIGIGNEEALFQGGTEEEYDHYIERFNLLYEAIKSKDPSIKIVHTAWWRPDSPYIEKVFRALDGKADYWDYHPGADNAKSGQWTYENLLRMKELFMKWNPNTTMKCAIFEENGSHHDVQRMLGHAGNLNAVRRMGDFVLTSCPANALQPYKQNDNSWDQGQIFFTPSQVWGMPPFYAQRVASQHHQPLLVHCESALLDMTATRSEDGKQLVLHMVNTIDKAVTARLNLKNFTPTSAKAITLTGELDAENTPEEPEKIAPVEQDVEVDALSSYAVPAYSYTIMVINDN